MEIVTMCARFAIMDRNKQAFLKERSYPIENGLFTTIENFPGKH